MLSCFVDTAKKTIPIYVVNQASYSTWLSSQGENVKSWLKATEFKPDAASFSCIPDSDGTIKMVVCAIAADDWRDLGVLPLSLPSGIYSFADFQNEYQSALAWGLGAYQFTRYKKSGKTPSSLLLSKHIADDVINHLEAIYLVRDAINTPCEDMNPADLSNLTRELARAFNADFSEVVGDELLEQNYPAVHAVGRASANAPRLLDLRWGVATHPKLTLVGKGVCYDTGGLDIKPPQYMLLMKKDMGGAANVLGLARMIMRANLPISLRVLIPAVENSVSGNAYRPGDVIKTRKGLSVEIGNTDCEGRLVLADAMTRALEDKPDLLIDMATLTGAARVAVGTEIAAMFANRDNLAQKVSVASMKTYDPVWQLPLYKPYRSLLKSQIADINNNASEPYAGAIAAALFLQEFVDDDIPWLHFDIMAYNTRPKPGRPQGGEAMGIRALFDYLKIWAQT